MARPASTQPTELELQLLKILWSKAPQSVSEIRAELCSIGHDIAHTSVITTLNTMVRKKYLKRKKEGKAFLFSPAMDRETVSKSILGKVVENVFGGSAKAVLLSLFDYSELDESELKELRQLINQKTKEKKK